MRTELVRVCGVLYRVSLTDGAMGEPEIFKVDFLAEDGLPASSFMFSSCWDQMLASDHVEAILMAVNDGNFVIKTKK